jgi:hypothetical protein
MGIANIASSHSALKTLRRLIDVGVDVAEEALVGPFHSPPEQNANSRHMQCMDTPVGEGAPGMLAPYERQVRPVEPASNKTDRERDSDRVH